MKSKTPSGSPRNPAATPKCECPPLHPVDWAIKAGFTEEVMLNTRLRVRRRRRIARATSGVAGLAIAGLLVFLFTGEPARPLMDVPVRSAVVAMPERQTLPDGSLIELKDGAAISVNFSVPLRQVVLDRGEAHFQVAKDAKRPFVVRASGIDVRAVGTAFSVQIGESTVEVLVTEGRVAIGQAGNGGPESVDETAWASGPLVEAGHRVVLPALTGTNERMDVSQPSAVHAVPPDEFRQRLAWRVPRLEFTQTPLVEAVPMINQYSGPARLVLGDAALGNVRLSGILRADNIETLLRLLEAEHGIKAEYRPNGEILLTPGR